MPQSTSASSKPKRVITEARKLQNREAQRAYRQRKKERLQQLRQTTGLHKEQSGAAKATQTTSRYQPLLPYPPPEGEEEREGENGQAGPSRPIEPPAINEEVHLSDDVPLEGKCTDLSSIVDDPALQLDIESTFLHDLVLPDPYANRLQTVQTSLLTACIYNAQSLGFNTDNLCAYNSSSACSPFYRKVSASDDPSALLAAVSNPSIPVHLQPTLPQILFPHHPFFDLLPLPTLRARAIMLAATAPSVVNPVDLKMDIVRGGLVCWGVREQTDLASGHPWDLRSWEAAPWFLQKWRLIVDGDLSRQSAVVGLERSKPWHIQDRLGHEPR